VAQAPRPGGAGESGLLSAVLIISFLALELALLVRAAQGRFVSQFPFFYSVAAFMLLSGVVVTVMYLSVSPYYPYAAWFRLLMSILIEFAVVVEISDHIFKPYPVIRLLGRSLALGICAVFFVLYVLPSLLESQQASLIMLEFVKRTSLTKAVAVFSLLAVAHYYRVRLGRNISGIALGFCVYLGINIINFALAEAYGPARYAQTLGVVWPLSYTIALLIWTVALWRYQPVLLTARALPGSTRRVSEPLSGQLERFNTELTRLLRR
jgi:hypothetical protein